jgi:serine/threonine-protein kinase PknG
MTEAFKAIGQARLEPELEAEYRVILYRRAMAMAAKGSAKLSGQTMTESMLRDLLVASYLELGRLTDDPAVRAGYVDLANSLRPWSLL